VDTSVSEKFGQAGEREAWQKVVSTYLVDVIESANPKQIQTLETRCRPRALKRRLWVRHVPNGAT
jgi:hypothetical protein